MIDVAVISSSTLRVSQSQNKYTHVRLGTTSRKFHCVMTVVLKQTKTCMTDVLVQYLAS